MENEIIMQADCWRWHWNEFPRERGWLRRVKNELDNHPRKTQRDITIQLSENKATGIVRGTWDMFYMVQPFVWIEFKIGNNTLSEDQKLFQKRGESIGQFFFVVYSREQFKKTINEIRKAQMDTNG